MNKPISGHINRRPVLSGNTEKFVNQAFTPPHAHRTISKLLVSIGVFIHVFSLIGFNNQRFDKTHANQSEIRPGKQNGHIISQKKPISLLGKNTFIDSSRPD